MKTAWTLVALLLLPGCADPDAVAPVTPPDGVWFTLTSGCGFCAGTGEFPEAETLVVYGDGTLLWYSFGIDPEADPAELAFEPGTEVRADAIRAVVAAQHDDYSSDAVRVFEAHAVRAEEWERFETVLASRHPRLDDPGEPRFDCSDCSAPWVEAFGPHVHAALHGNFSPGSDWYQVLNALWDLEDQVKPVPSY